ncbi:MAG TPA: YibE/F family protein [Clostridiales bacterium]|nr:YibE/F family protein [Clostridiales bacterium]
MDIKNSAVYVITIVASLLFILIGNRAFSDYSIESYDDIDVYKAKVVSIDTVEDVPGFFEGDVDRNVFFTAKILNGAEKGTTVPGVQRISSMIAIQDKEIDKGDRILIAYTVGSESDELEWLFVSYNRVNTLAYLCGAFLLLIVLIGRLKGVQTILALSLTCLMIFLVYIPSILSGVNVYISTIAVSAAIILASLLLINGANKKTLCAVAGNLSGVIIAGLLALFMNSTLKLTGIIDEHYVYLTYVNADNPLNLISIIWGGMVLGSLGAVMDVAMSISSSMHELAEHMSRRSFSKMLRSGMNIGRDVIGTMTNTLILAYIGGSLALVLLLIVNTKNTLYLLSMEMIAVQVVQSVVGSMGILFAVPFTTLFAAFVYTNTDERGRE